MNVKVVKNPRGQANQLFKSESNNKRKRPHPPENDEGKRNSPPSKTRKIDESDLYTPTKDETRTCRSPSPSIPDSCNKQKSINSLVSDGGVSRNIDFDEEAASVENKLIQHLTKLSEIMEPILKRTDSPPVFDLLTDPKFADACIDVARGMKLLKGGLTTITRELLCGRMKSKL
ncbi:PREDICTED: uncharacterized protein LOC101295826 [Fragaria vesca subsp. vesca]|uniref:uncharacterized protein LOC101295826 n=1 Tax=Fragaria vesca subsp. vesca TaxID=101020 RepID=UPI0002C3638C|nr:PREDICTED: uncharacterized protein LOC101295826 [Fragaria vesca subsp. vesca]